MSKGLRWQRKGIKDKIPTHSIFREVQKQHLSKELQDNGLHPSSCVCLTHTRTHTHTHTVNIATATCGALMHVHLYTCMTPVLSGGTGSAWQSSGCVATDHVSGCHRILLHLRLCASDLIVVKLHPGTKSCVRTELLHFHRLFVVELVNVVWAIFKAG